MTETNFPSAEANYKTIEKLMLEPENKKCADCTASSADGYICLDFGTFVCFYCAEVLRAHKHKVKKIAPGNIRDEDLAIVQNNGNRVSYDKWLVRYTGDHPEPDSAHNRTYRTEYLRLKYDEKKWARPDATPFEVVYEEFGSSSGANNRSRSTSTPPAFVTPNPFVDGYNTNPFAQSPPAHVQYIQQQQVMQHQLLANQQHLAQQHMQQQMMQQQLHQNQAALNHQMLQQQQQQQQIFVQQNAALANPLTQSLTQNPESRTRSPSFTGSYNSPVPPILATRGPSPAPTPSPRAMSPVNSYGSNTPVSPYGSNTPVSPYGANPPVSPYGSNTPVSPYGANPPVSPYASNTPVSPYGTASPVPFGTSPVSSYGTASPVPYAANSGTTSPVNLPTSSSTGSVDASRQLAAGRQRSNSKIGVCPQCGAGVDSREMGKHKLKECPYRTASAQ